MKKEWVDYETWKRDSNPVLLITDRFLGLLILLSSEHQGIFPRWYRGRSIKLTVSANSRLTVRTILPLLPIRNHGVASKARG